MTYWRRIRLCVNYKASDVQNKTAHRAETQLCQCKWGLPVKNKDPRTIKSWFTFMDRDPRFVGAYNLTWLDTFHFGLTGWTLLLMALVKRWKLLGLINKPQWDEAWFTCGRRLQVNLHQTTLSLGRGASAAASEPPPAASEGLKVWPHTSGTHLWPWLHLLLRPDHTLLLSGHRTSEVQRWSL